MELKKSPKADLQRRRSLFLEIGLVISLVFVIAAFWYNQPEKGIKKIDLGKIEVDEEIMEITRQDEKPPETVRQPLAIASDILDVVRNDAKITEEFNFDEFSEDAPVLAPVQVKEEEIIDDAPIFDAEVMPQFQGGDINDFRNWVQSCLRYPDVAAKNNISGRVTIGFVIERDGSLTNIQVLQSPDRSLSDEAVRVLKTSPKWTPGRQRSQTVRVGYNLPIEFRIQQQ